MSIYKLISNLVEILNAFILSLIGIGFIFSQNIRDNMQSLFMTLWSYGFIGGIAFISIILLFKDTPKTIKKLYKAKGLNTTFLNDL